MDRESFLETISREIAAEITEAFVECEDATGRLDQSMLKLKLDKIAKAAFAQGLRENEYVDLVNSVLPQKIGYKFGEEKKAA